MFHQELDDSSNEDGHTNQMLALGQRILVQLKVESLRIVIGKRLKLTYHKFEQFHCIIRSLAQALGLNKSILHGLFKDGLLQQHWWSLSEVKVGPFPMYASFVL